MSRWAAAHWRRRYDEGDRIDRAIVNTASGSGLLNPLPAQSNYAAANATVAAVAAMTTVHALELRWLGVRVNCVSASTGVFDLERASAVSPARPVTSCDRPGMVSALM